MSTMTSKTVLRSPQISATCMTYNGSKKITSTVFTSLQVASEKKMGIPMMPKTAINFKAIRLRAATNTQW